MSQGFRAFGGPPTLLFHFFSTFLVLGEIFVKEFYFWIDGGFHLSRLIYVVYRILGFGVWGLGFGVWGLG